MAKRKSRKSTSPTRLIASFLAAIAILLVAYFNPELLSSLLNPSSPSNPSYPPLADRSDEIAGKLQIHFFDVGQGDAALFLTPDGKSVLIDAGPGSDEDRLLGYLEALEIERLDFIVFTHPHEDHIGGGDVVIQNFEIGRILMPDCTSSSATFEKLLLAIDEKDLSIETVTPRDTYSLSELTFTVVGPYSPSSKDANNSSIVLHLTYGDTAFLFSGDAEKDEEAEILAKYSGSLAADVYKVGHHGSSTSSHEEFLAEIQPSFAVFSCGAENEYGHPHEQTVTRLSNLGAILYRTDLQGNILLLSDGKTVS